MTSKSIFIILIAVLLSLQAFAAGEVLDLTEQSATNTQMSTPEGPYSDNLGDLRRIQKAFNSSKEFQNTLVYDYNRLSTYKIRLRTAMDTLLVLPENEVITIFNFGDDKNFNFVPLKNPKGDNTNMGIIKNLHPGADTNLIIIGVSGNSYNFYLRIDDYSSKFLPHLKVFIKDKDIAAKLSKHQQPVGLSVSKTRNVSDGTFYRKDMDLRDYLRKIDNTPMRILHRNQNLDFRYTIYKKGNVIAPLAVFDDGYWTYFRMTTDDNMDKLSEMPVVLKVVSGVETPVNTRVVNNYIIAETTGSIFALRIDNRVLCIEKTVDHPKRFIK